MPAKPKSKPSESKSGKTTRDGFADGLMHLGEHVKEVVALTADLGKSVGMEDFEKEYPQRFFQIGIAEQNMAGIAAGLALEGYIPFMSSFASFQPMRNLDQIRTSICIMDTNVKIVSSHAGFSYAGDGIQIQTLEDIAVMRSLPNMQVLVPADAEQAAQMVKLMAKHTGPQYIRLGRAPLPKLSGYVGVDPDSFEETEIGKAQVLRPGGDAVIIATGVMVFIALDAAAQLASQGVHVQVLNMHTIKPLDVQAVLSAAEATGRIVTVEEHQAAGGLGSAVSEVLATSDIHCRQRIVAVQDQFGETSRDNADLYTSRGLTVENVVSKVKELLQ